MRRQYSWFSSRFLPFLPVLVVFFPFVPLLFLPSSHSNFLFLLVWKKIPLFGCRENTRRGGVKTKEKEENDGLKKRRRDS